VKRNARYPDAEEVPYTVLVNPVITPLTPETESGWEGCLSVPGLRGMVPRYTSVRYMGKDQHGKTIDRSVDSFHARVVQHECDHLNGILYPMRMTDFRTFGFTDVLFPGNAVMEE
jgi:peptide deformylase